MTADQRTIAAVIAAILADHPVHTARTLYVAEPVWQFMQNTYVLPGTASALMNVPVVVDDDLTGGQWQLRENGETVSSGDMAPAPEDMIVMYSPYAGWYAVSSELAAEAAALTTWTNA